MHSDYKNLFQNYFSNIPDTKRSELEAFASSPSGRELNAMLGDDVKKALDSGDQQAFAELIRKIMNTQQGSELAGKLNDFMGKR